MSARKPPEHLSPREGQIIALLAEGLVYKQIAARLHLTEATVKQYMAVARERTRTSMPQLISRVSARKACSSCPFYGAVRWAQHLLGVAVAEHSPIGRSGSAV